MFPMSHNNIFNQNLKMQKVVFKRTSLVIEVNNIIKSIKGKWKAITIT